jgi:type II secretory pathway component PulM
MTGTEYKPENSIRAKDADTNKPKRHRTLLQKWDLLTLANKLIVIATIVIAVANSMYTVIALKTLREIQNSSSDTQSLASAANKEADKVETISASVEKSVAQFDRIAGVAEKSLYASIAASRLDERA